MITEVIMGPGSIDVRLRPDTPLSIRRLVPYMIDGYPFGHLIVTPTRLSEGLLSQDQILAASCFTARITRRSEQMHRFAGEGIGIWLGDSNGMGEFMETNATHSLENWLDAITNGTLGYTNGLTKGTNYSATATSYVGPLSSDPYTTAKNLLDTVCAATSNAYRVTPQGEIDYGTPANLFRSTPTCIIVRAPGGRAMTSDVITLPATQLDVSEDLDDFPQYVNVSGGGFAHAVAYAKTMTSFNRARNISWEVHQTSRSTVSAAVDAESHTYAAAWQKSRRQISCRVDFRNITRVVLPGDNVYVFDPETDIYSTTSSTRVQVRGRIVYPETMQVREITWPITAGMGVYAIRSADTWEWLDLSDWYVPETDDTTLALGAAAFSAREVVTAQRRFS